MDIRTWRKLERHPLSNEYEDIKGKDWERFVEGVKKHGVIDGRKVVIHEKKVIDGWQLYRACLEADVKPDFSALKLPKDMTAEEWVAIRQEHRRHESQERMQKRREERIKRVAAARVEGQSIRTIAEDEGVSPGQVHRDLEEATVSGETVTPPTGNIVGKDDREQPAAKPLVPPKKLCRDCRIGPARPRCPKCKELNKPEREAGDDTEAEKEARKRAKQNGKPLFDWKPFESSFGVLVRQVDLLGKAYKAKESSEANALRKTLGEWHKAFKGWHKDLTKAKARAS